MTTKARYIGLWRRMKQMTHKGLRPMPVSGGFLYSFLGLCYRVDCSLLCIIVPCACLPPPPASDWKILCLNHLYISPASK